VLGVDIFHAFQATLEARTGIRKKRGRLKKRGEPASRRSGNVVQGGVINEKCLDQIQLRRRKGRGGSEEVS
jgi:hypothetical protein